MSPYFYDIPIGSSKEREPNKKKTTTTTMTTMTRTTTGAMTMVEANGRRSRKTTLSKPNGNIN